MVAPLVVGIALGFPAGVHLVRAQDGEAALRAGSGGGGRGEGCIGVSATCASALSSGGRFPVPRWCAARRPAPGAFPDAGATLERLVVTPRAAAADVRAAVADDVSRASAFDEMAQCYREALAVRATTGRITVRVRFDEAGCVRRADVTRDETGDPHLARCAAYALYGMRHLAAPSPPVEARLTIQFRRAPPALSAPRPSAAARQSPP